MIPKAEFQRLKPVRILLLEDEPDSTALVRHYLVGSGSQRLSLECVTTLAEALAQLRREDFDLVLCDLNVPDSKGLDTLEGMVAATERMIIVLTGDDAPALAEAALERGAYDFLHKKDLNAATLKRLVRLAAMQSGSFRSLHDSEERFRSLVELSSDMYWEQDTEYRFVALSGKAPQWLERRRSRLLGQHRWDGNFFNMGEADWARHKADLDARRVFHELELGRINEEGDIVWVSVSGEPVFGPDGAFKGYRGIGKDITLRKREERLLALEHAVTRRLAEAGSVSEALRGVLQAICESENWHNGRYFNLDEATGVMRFAEGWHAGGGALAQFAETSRGRTFALGEGLVGHVWRSGEPLWVPDVQSDPRVASSARVQQAGVHSALLVPVAFEGRVSGVLSMSSGTIRKPEERLLGALRVIGSQIGQFLQRKQVESALHESEARFRQTYELAAAGIAHVALDGRYLRVNRKLCEILGYPEAELIARSVKDISHPDDRDVTDHDRARLIAGEVASVRTERT